MKGTLNSFIIVVYSIAFIIISIIIFSSRSSTSSHSR